MPSDLLSLPDDVLLHIASHLTRREAARGAGALPGRVRCACSAMKRMEALLSLEALTGGVCPVSVVVRIVEFITANHPNAVFFEHHRLIVPIRNGGTESKRIYPITILIERCCNS